MKRYFLTGIGTDVGKTITAAVLTQALGSDYWKPVQAGSLDFTDTMRVKSLKSRTEGIFHPEAYLLKHALSPHAAADLEGMEIALENICLPECNNHLIIEGAGGLMVPLNHQSLIIDLIPQFSAEVILVSRNYLGSINHTLLSAFALKQYAIPVKGIIFNGNPNLPTEKVIMKHTGLKMLARIPEMEEINPKQIEKAAQNIDLRNFV
jgi:dethiobiotin synthetase